MVDPNIWIGCLGDWAGLSGSPRRNKRIVSIPTTCKNTSSLIAVLEQRWGSCSTAQQKQNPGCAQKVLQVKVAESRLKLRQIPHKIYCFLFWQHTKVWKPNWFTLWNPASFNSGQLRISDTFRLLRNVTESDVFLFRPESTTAISRVCLKIPLL